MRVIDSDKLKAEINGIIKAITTNGHPDVLGTEAECLVAAENEVLNLVLETIDTLEKEKSKTDTEKLEKEIQSYLESEGVGYGGWIDGWRDEDLREIARHFYKLGQNGW